MPYKISRSGYAEIFGATVGDRVRLGDTSLTLEVEFDDFLDQTSELIGVSASLGPDSLGPPQVSRIMHQRDYVERLRAIRDSSYVADSIQFVEDQERIELLR